MDSSDCEYSSERWAPAGSDPCDFEGGIAFYGSATFDPDAGPGVRATTENGVPAWGGYAYAGDLVVYASDGDRVVSQAVLDSVREVGPGQG